MKHIIDELDRLRRRTRVMLIVQRLAVLLAWTVGAIVVLVLLDYSLRFPSALRMLFLIAGVGLLGAGVARYFRDAVIFRPSLTQLALRVEQSIPSVRGRLASGVEFAMGGIDQTNVLAGRSVRDVERRLEGASVSGVVRPARLWRGVGALAVVALIAMQFILISPGAAATGLSRMLLPYGGAQWPARTAVASLMHEVLVREGVHPQGQALALRAQNRTIDDDDGRVDAHYRLERDGAFESWQTAVLTYQGSAVHERLVDTNADRLEVYFSTEDARTETESIELVPPPAVVRAALRVRPPAYAEGRVPDMEADLGPGIDERSVTDRPSLIGSRAELTVELNKPLPVPESAAEREPWLERTFVWSDEQTRDAARFDVVGDGSRETRTWSLSWPVQRTSSLSIALRDVHGLTNNEPIQYRVEASEDLSPTVTITEPARDETVLPSAVVSVSGEAKDDVAVSRIGLVAAVQRAGRAAGSAGGADAPEPLAFAPERSVDAVTAGITDQLDLARFDLGEGDLVLLTAVADDLFEIDGRRHETARSPVRRLRITSELEFAAQLRRQLSAVRQNAIRTEAQQAELQDDVRETGVQPGVDRAQAQVAERIGTQRQVVDELREQLDRNRLDDPQLEELLQQSQDLLDYAGRAANRAVEGIEAARGEEAEPADERQREIDEAQQEVRDELGDLIELLDRDEDTWIVQRQLESLLEAQSRLESETQQLAQETLGQELSDLTEDQRSELDRIVQQQLELPAEARRLIEEMRRRAAALDELDPQSASGMRSAAETGERREVDRDMQQAAERAQQNQLQAAGAAQQSSRQSLERMLEDLRETSQARAEELLRQLASLIESIDRLIVVQENELISLAVAEERDTWTGRDRAMIRLNQNTQSVAAEARAAGQPARRIARTLDRAGDAQGAAVTALRAKPLDPAEVRAAEDRSLELLKEARELAEELEQKTEEEHVQEQRQALIEAYRALAEKQIAVRAETLELAGAEELSRRQLVDARRIGNAQETIRTGLADLETTTREIMESDVFAFVHRLIDGWSRDVSTSLWEGRVNIDVTDRQAMIADSIARQIEALEESMAPPDPFEQEGDAGGGGGSGSGPPPLIPPPAEIKRLHGLQEQVYNETRAVDSRQDLDRGTRRQRVRELGEMQRELIRLGEKMLERLQGAGEPPPGAGDEQAPPDEGQP
ncbi:MAG: hypothetical protein GY715_09660 [Planctomycetes bacterium]|nr:hypothetical protein [Planctomycetota bacterium]